MRSPNRLAAAALLSLAVAVGCTREEPTESPQSAATDALSPAARERLEALGYEPWVEEEAPPQNLGVLEYDPARTADGFVLFANRGTCSAVLIDRSGRVLNTWSAPPPASGYWSDTRLLPDGTLLVVGSHSYSSAKQQKDRFLRRLAWDSSVVWEADFPAHHDVEVAADGAILTLSSDVRAIEHAGVATKIIDDLIIFLGDDGTTRESFSLFDAFTATPGVTLQRIDRRMVNVGGTQAVDLFHTNSVDRVALPALVGSHSVYTEGNILFSSRHQNTIAVLDPKQGKLVWRWGPGILEGQHSARWMANGNILVFDNGMVRRHSRVLEIDPRTNAIVWEYPGTKQDRFFTAGGGASQRLPNGNTLVTVTGQGMIFEVTAAGDVVWRFVNPNVDPQKRRRATIHASTWMPPELVLPVLARQR